MSSREQEKQRQRAARRRRRPGLLAGGGLVAVVIVAVLVVLGGGSDRPSGLGGGEGVAGAAEVEGTLAGIPQDGTALGDPDASVTLTEVVDLQCPFCRDFALDALPGLVERYVRPGKVRIELRLLTFLGPDSERAGEVAAAAARQDRMWEFVDIFFHNQGREGSGYATDEFLARLARATPGLDAERALAGSGAAASVDMLRQARDDAERVGISSTPSFLAARPGGEPRPLEVGALTTEAFAEQLDALLDGGP